MDWTQKEKDELAKWINDHYFENQNFGSVSKADFETYIFSLYIENLLDNKENFDDYTIGKHLGLTISRVRSLKERKELKYPREGYNWKDSFIECVKNAKFDETTHLVKISIPDVNVLKDLRYFLEKNGWYDEYQLNPKLFQCRADVFYDLCIKLDSDYVSPQLDEESRKKLKDIVKQSKEEEDQGFIETIIKGELEEGLKKILKYSSKFIINSVLQVMPFGGLVKRIIDEFTIALNK